MENATLADVARHIAKLEHRRARTAATHGKPGRGGALVDASASLTKIDRQLSDWRRILAFAQTEGD